MAKTIKKNGGEGPHFNSTHGMRYTPEYKAWSGMIWRCSYYNMKDYYSYWLRGIRVCDRWKSFENFYEDMGDHPGEGLSLDRIDNDKGYFPENCRWATKSQQSSNQRFRINTRSIGVKSLRGGARFQAIYRSKNIGSYSTWEEARFYRLLAGVKHQVIDNGLWRELI